LIRLINGVHEVSEVSPLSSDATPPGETGPEKATQRELRMIEQMEAVCDVLGMKLGETPIQTAQRVAKRVERLSHDVFGGDSGLSNEFDRMEAERDTIRSKIETMRQYIYECRDRQNTWSVRVKFNELLPPQDGE
jgi:hypothetical protein